MLHRDDRKETSKLTYGNPNPGSALFYHRSVGEEAAQLLHAPAAPVVDRVAALPGLTVGTGMSGHGFGIGPGMGKVLAALVMGDDPGHDLTRFRLSRFSDGSKMHIGPSV